MLRLGLCLLAALSVAAAFVAGPPQYGFPEPQEDKTKFGFDDIWNFRPAGYSGQWFGDQLVYTTQDGDVVSRENGSMHANDTLVIAGQTLKDQSVSLYFPSPDLSHVLLVSGWKQVWRHSYTAVYHIYNVHTKDITSVHDGARLQYCRWAPVHNHLMYVLDNNMVFLNVTSGNHVNVTSDGQAGTVFNGIPDWMYEEDVLSVAVAHYWSPDADYVVFAKFDDTLVTKQQFKMYGERTDVYGQIEEIAYPKAGDVTNGQAGPITAASLHLWKVSENLPVSPNTITPPASIKDQDHYYTRVAWVSEQLFTVTWTNRVQNESVVQTCTLNTGTPVCNDHFEHKVSGGWIDSPWPSPVVVSSDDAYIIPLSKDEGDSGSWKHVAMLNAKDNSANVTFLTKGQWEVLSIRAYDAKQEDIYYLGTGGDPTKRHLYKLGLKNSSAEPVCVSCSVQGCQYVSASFSKSKDNYILSCYGPDIPSYSIRSTRDDSVWVVEDNKSFRDEIAKKLMPTREFMDFKVGGYTTQAEIIKPPNFDANKKYPLLIFAYAGPGSQRVMQTYELGSSQRNWLNYLRSSHDVVVASIDSRGAAARGDKFKYEMYRRFSTVEVQDHITFAKHLRDNKDYLDNDKDVAIFGWSYGGQTSSHVLAESPDTIRCAIAVAPGTTQTFYDSAYTERFMGLATDNEAGYNGSDVMHKAPMFKDKKYLIAHGTADDNVHFMNAAHMIDALVKEEIQFKQLMYVDENHSIGTRTHSRHLFRALTDFLVDECWDLNAPVVTPIPNTTPGSGAATTVPTLTLLAAVVTVCILRIKA